MSDLEPHRGDEGDPAVLSPSAAAPEPQVAGAEPSASPGPSAAAPRPPASAAVARALAELAALPNLELAEHPDAYQRIHAELQGALTSIDDA